ncbi:MAG: hypothetical protein WAP35_03240 [Solirubrobacterales bacterium]
MTPLKPESANSPTDYINQIDLNQIDQPRRDQIKRLDKFIRETVPGLKRHLAGSEGTAVKPQLIGRR